MVEEDPSDDEELRALTRRLLLDAGALGRLPTPIDDIVAAAKLREPRESFLSESMLARAPQYIRAAIAPFRHKVRALLDRREREIHLDPTIDIPGKRNFNRLHEVVHDLAPWQTDLVVADTDRDLSPATHRRFEREANEGASQLLFQHELAGKIAAQYPVGLDTVVKLHEMFGGSIRATLRVYARDHRSPVLAVVLDCSPLSQDPLSFQRREIIASTTWTRRFGAPGFGRVITWPSERWLTIAAASNTSVVAAGDDAMNDLAGAPRAVRVEFLDTSYQLLGLIWAPGR